MQLIFNKRKILNKIKNKMANTTLNQLDLQIFSRQLNGSTMSEKELLDVHNMKPFIIGANSNGSEVVKNLVKNGMRDIYLHDEFVVEEKDIKNIYFLFDGDLGLTKADALKKYNPNIQIILRSEINKDYIRTLKIDCIVVTTILEWDFLKRLNDIAKELQIPFILGCNMGLSFFVFSCFPQLQGENDNKPQRSHYHFEKYFSTETSLDQILNLQTYNELHQETFALLCTIFEYLKQHNQLPELFSIEDSEEFYTKLQSMAQIFEINLRFTKETYCKYIMNSRIELAAVAQVCGALIATEVLKSVIKRLEPYNQVIFWEDMQQMRNAQIDHHQQQIRSKKQFFDYEMLLGEQIMNDIANLKVLLVGCGAVGCEQVKNLYSIGACRGEKGHLYLVDDDLIEGSNIPRQVCFTYKDIKQNKAKTCQNWLQKKGSSIKVTSYDILLCKENENVFTYEFFKNIDLIIIAVDSSSAREYIADKAIEHKIFLIESGTHGFEAQSQSQIPYLSKRIEIPVKEQISTASCTAKSALKNEGDSLVYSKSIFNSEFSQLRTDDDVTFLTNQLLQDLMQLYSKMQDNLNFCFKVLKLFVIEIFNKMFYDDVIQIGKISNQNYNPFKFDEKNPDHLELVDSLCHILNQALTEFSQKNSLDNKNSIIIQSPSQILPIFDKDDFFHANIAYQISKLRSQAFNINYKLERYDAVGKIGNIIPAIIQSTSVASGFAFLQIIPWLINKEEISQLYQEIIQENSNLRQQQQGNNEVTQKANLTRNDLFLSEDRVLEFKNRFNQLGFVDTFGNVSYPDSLNRSRIKFEIAYLNSFDLKVKTETKLPEIVQQINEILSKNALPETYVVEIQQQKIFWKDFQSNRTVFSSLKQSLSNYQQQDILSIIKSIQSDYSLSTPCKLVIFTSKLMKNVIKVPGEKISEINIFFD
ncbi:ubiquitin-activating enzyme E1, putative (macronuclear) [Tetrahymena thermophila SB210]|uniref:Ubiquitin-activating enzyme E1, putative n=1 Tax=Tetrahymena thermophila (strain SB210) TaxID=312017 RepID=Q238S6_TETTS|nr:ubiquitin-activating enzyme E1, putative [Tetrahymena thermophila SB210]EAR93144.2 ubiquitin-activating enzyme E1, putative [Tetrahymena thermophila SB210]|eukprot:XP_001013389.2 ubiquitin-activating enzyme E1, putative [Tetrahymena thermophila SB210]